MSRSNKHVHPVKQNVGGEMLRDGGGGGGCCHIRADESVFVRFRRWEILTGFCIIGSYLFYRGQSQTEICAAQGKTHVHGLLLLYDYDE